MPRDPHDPRDPARMAAMAADPAVREAAQRLFDLACRYRYSYNFTWAGRPIIQFPEDLVTVQELIWEVKPDLIVETGIAHGGSLVFHASMLEALGGDGIVLGVDVDIRAHNRAAIEAHPLARRIEMIQGSSTDPAIGARVAERARGKQRVLVLLDSDHTHAHVAGELRLYAPLVTPGSYLIVFDTVIEHMPDDAFPDRRWGRGNNPLTAVREFLAADARFEIARDVQDRLLLTVAPDGYLRRRA